jgi:hypothetical protein
MDFVYQLVLKNIKPQNACSKFEENAEPNG